MRREEEPDQPRPDTTTIDRVGLTPQVFLGLTVLGVLPWLLGVRGFGCGAP